MADLFVAVSPFLVDLDAVAAFQRLHQLLADSLYIFFNVLLGLQTLDGAEVVPADRGDLFRLRSRIASRSFYFRLRGLVIKYHNLHTAADIVLMDDDPLKIAKAIRISRKCLRIVYENIWFAIGIKLICLVLGAVGIANMWLAIFADVGVMIIAVLNAIRALFVKKL